MGSSDHEGAWTARELCRTGTTTDLELAEQCHRRGDIKAEFTKSKKTLEYISGHLKHEDKKYNKKGTGRPTCVAEIHNQR